jgi:hypothetical protein
LEKAAHDLRESCTDDDGDREVTTLPRIKKSLKPLSMGLLSDR